MNERDAVTALAALAQESRLAVFRLLVHRGPDGYSAGEISEQLGIPGPTLSFHLLQPQLRAHARAGGLPDRQLLQPRRHLHTGMCGPCRHPSQEEIRMKRLHAHVSVRDPRCCTA
jgi:DNA-binding transcriptional ArsR family regulator